MLNWPRILMYCGSFHSPFQSEEMFLKSVKLTEELNCSDRKRKISQAYTNMGLMYWQQNRIDEAIEYTEKSIDVSLFSPDDLTEHEA